MENYITNIYSINSKTWDYFEHISSIWETPIKRDKSETWKGIYSLYPMHSMLFQHWKITFI